MENSDHQQIVEKIKSLPTSTNKSLIIAISGYGGSGKSTLAAELQQQLDNAEVISSDDFIINRCAERTADWSSYDRSRLRNQVLEPASYGQTIRYQIYDWENNQLGKWRAVPTSKYLLIEGVSILHPDLRHFYDYAIWINCPLDIATKRGLQRDNEWGNDHDDMWNNIWMPNERDYFEKYRPDLAADTVINANDLSKHRAS
ncbi:MAG TPA: AAA family ATPase [Candidatus Saccharimonadales bacterium]|nr:AAA family ATPase [Candidatus Saccharimonadales bacterium]